MKSLTLQFNPPEECRAAVAHALAQLREATGPTARLRRIEPAGKSFIEFFAPDDAHSASIKVIINPAEVALGDRRFAATHGAGLVEPLLPSLRTALLHFLRLESDHLPDLRLDHFTVLQVTVEYLFLCDSPESAAWTAIELSRHQKIVADFPNPAPTRGWKARTRRHAMVNWSDKPPHALEMTLPFGSSRSYVAFDHDRFPAEFSEPAGKNEGREFMQRVLCIEVTVSIDQLVDPEYPTKTLSDCLPRWRPTESNVNPYEFIWKAFSWAVWLNLDLAKNEADVPTQGIGDSELYILTEYFQGRSVKNHRLINEDAGRFMSFRKALIVSAGVDLLNPWRYFKNNSATELRKKLRYEERLQPQKAVDAIAELTLTMEIAQQVAASSLEGAG